MERTKKPVLIIEEENGKEHVVYGDFFKIIVYKDGKYEGIGMSIRALNKALDLLKETVTCFTPSRSDQKNT